MSLALAATQSVQASAGSASAIAYTISGDQISGTPPADAWSVFAQGFLPVTPGSLYSSPGATQSLIKRIQLCNVTAGAVACAMFVNGTAATNKSVGMTIPANGSAEWTENGWVVLDATGNRLTAAGVGPQGSKGMLFRGAYSGATAYAVDDVVRDQSSSWIALQATTGNAPPTLPTTSDARWSLVAQQGAQGIQGLTGNTGTPGTNGTNGVITTVNTTAPITGGGSASTLTLALAANGIDATLLAQAAAATVRGRALGAGTGNQQDLTGAQVADTIAGIASTAYGRGKLAIVDAAADVALLPTATNILKGLLSVADKKIIDSLHYDVVADFGWIGDDSNDNGAGAGGATSWATIMATLPTGAVLFFPAGTYRTSVELTIAVDKRITFKGVSRYASVIKTTSATANIFNKTVAGWYDQFVDLGFQSSVTKTAGAALAISNGNNVGMNAYRLWITGLFKGIDAQNGAGGQQPGNLSVWADLDISGVPNGGRGIHINGAVVNVMIHNATINCGAATASACCEINQSGAVQVTACDWIQGTNVLLINGNAGSGAQAAYFTNCFFDQPQQDVIKVIGTNTSNRIKFTQCGIATAVTGYAGILIAGTGAGGVGTQTALPAGISIVDCDIYHQAGGSTGAGIRLNGAGDVNIQNTRVAGYSGAGGAGVYCTGSAGNQTKLRVNGCIIGPNSNLTITNTTGVKVDGTALGFLSITDNSLLGNTTAIDDTSGVLATATKNIKDNQGAANGLSAQAVAGGTLTTTTETAVPGMQIYLPPNSIKVGTTVTWSRTDTVSATSTTIEKARIGTAGTTGDATNISATSAASAAAASVQTQGSITFTSIGAAGAFVGAVSFVQGAVAGGAPVATVTGTVNTTVGNYVTITTANGTANTRTYRGGYMIVVSPA